MPVYEFACCCCDRRVESHLSIEQYESITFKKGGTVFVKVPCDRCGEGIFRRVYNSFGMKNSTDETKIKNRLEKNLLLSAEKHSAWKKGGQRGLQEHRDRHRGETHDKTGRREKSWEEKIKGGL